jgi:outer membrane receptor protein involved in Fe transport
LDTTTLAVYPNVTFNIANGNNVPPAFGPATRTISAADRQRFDQMTNALLGRVDLLTQTFYSDLETFQPSGEPRVRNFKRREKGFFFQDDWKVSRKLTLNLGLRYEFYGVPFESEQFQGTLDHAANVNHVSTFSNAKILRSTESLVAIKW